MFTFSPSLSSPLSHFLFDSFCFRWLLFTQLLLCNDNCFYSEFVSTSFSSTHINCSLISIWCLFLLLLSFLFVHILHLWKLFLFAFAQCDGTFNSYFFLFLLVGRYRAPETVSIVEYLFYYTNFNAWKGMLCVVAPTKRTLRRALATIFQYGNRRMGKNCCSVSFIIHSSDECPLFRLTGRRYDFFFSLSIYQK